MSFFTAIDWTSLFRPEMSLPEAERRLRREGVSCLPVVAGGLLVGTVCLADLGGDVAHAA